VNNPAADAGQDRLLVRGQRSEAGSTGRHAEGVRTRAVDLVRDDEDARPPGQRAEPPVLLVEQRTGKGRFRQPALDGRQGRRVRGRLRIPRGGHADHSAARPTQERAIVADDLRGDRRQELPHRLPVHTLALVPRINGKAHGPRPVGCGGSP
jgi:hypothetical protein